MSAPFPARLRPEAPAVARLAGAGAVLAVGLAGAAGPAGPLAAQEARAGDTRPGDALDDVFHVWSAPGRLDSDDLPALGAVAGTTLLLAALDEPLREWTRSRPPPLPVRLVEPFRLDGPLHGVGRTPWMLPFSAVLYAAGHLADHKGLRDAGLGCATSNLATTLARTAVTRVPGRLRPGAGRGPYSFRPFTLSGWQYRSLPGGHVANIASCTSFWTRRFDLGAAEPLLHLLSALVGLGRMADDAHWASDIFLGLSLGSAVGKDVADRFRERAHPPEDPGAVAGEAPSPLVVIEWRIPF